MNPKKGIKNSTRSHAQLLAGFRRSKNTTRPAKTTFNIRTPVDKNGKKAENVILLPRFQINYSIIITYFFNFFLFIFMIFVKIREKNCILLFPKTKNNVKIEKALGYKIS